MSIRKNDMDPCPFGLSIPFACSKAGDCIRKLAPEKALGDEAEDNEKSALARANRKMLSWCLMQGETPKRCVYAAKVFPDQRAVECNFEDTAPGVGEKASLVGAPFYSQIFSGIAMNGLYSYPIGYYADYNITRNLAYGLYSLQGSEDFDPVRKTAELIVMRARLAKQMASLEESSSANKPE